MIQNGFFGLLIFCRKNNLLKKPNHNSWFGLLNKLFLLSWCRWKNILKKI